MLFFFFYFSQKSLKQNKTSQVNQKNDEIKYSANIIDDVSYTSKDADGNEYIIKALKGEIDIENSNILFLTEVKALIKLKNSEKITVYSDYGKYNSENFDTIFSKNVIIEYLDNKITCGYLDFSLQANEMIISKDVIFKTLNETLTADVVEINIETKDTKIYMHENQKT